MQYAVHQCVLPEHRESAASLYAEAFRHYFAFSPAIQHNLASLLGAGLALDRGFSAVAETGELVGVVGMSYRGASLVNISFRMLQQRFGLWRAARQWLGIIVLHRSATPGQLLLDGIATVPAARGHGVGTALLNEVVSFAHKQGFKELRLDVVDTNPRAKMLYERVGFVEIRRSVLPAFMAQQLGFSASSTMIKYT